MKIVHIVQYLMQGHTYQENYLPHAMARMGHTVTIIAGTDNPDFFTDTPHKSGDIVEDRGCTVRYTRMQYGSLWTRVDDLYALLEQEAPDLVFVHGFLLTRCFALRRYMLRHKNCRFVCDTHETFVLAFNGCFTNSLKNRVRRFVYFGCVYRLWRRMVERHYEKVFYVSPPRREYATEAFGFHEETLESLWLGADLATLPYDQKQALRPEIRRRHNLPETENILMLAGKLDRLKHPVELAKAFCRLDLPNWTLMYVGSVPDDVRQELDAVLGDAGRVVYTGFLPGDEVLRYLAACDLAVYPGAPSVLWQQTVCLGVPAVFFEPKPGYASYLSDDSARFVKLGTPDELVDVLRPLMEQDALRKEMGVRARAHGERILSYDKLAQKALDLAFASPVPKNR